MKKVEGHYDKKYFDWQSSIGNMSGELNKFKFEPFIKPTDNVIDFGCGGGYLLEKIICKEKAGIEINDSAIEKAKSKGLNVYKNISELEDNWADIIISNHALEHCENPSEILAKLYPKLKLGGKIVFVVPSETFLMNYNEKDINNHLFSWSPQSLANLFRANGFNITESNVIFYKWPPFYMEIYKYFGTNIFNIIARIWGIVSLNWTQIRVVATKI